MGGDVLDICSNTGEFADLPDRVFLLAALRESVPYM